MRPLGSSRPMVVLGSLTAICLAVFAASIPLPRTDGQLLSGDGFGYYAYLPSLVLDGDLDFSDEVQALGMNAAALPARRTPTGLLANPWPVGAALLWLPFFLLAHALAIGLNAFGAGIRMDGCGYWHQAFVIGGNILYGGGALVFAFDASRRVTSTGAALSAAVLLACAGNLFYYMTLEPSLAHPVSAFAVGAFFWLWIRWRGGSGMRRAVALGAVLGVIATVRTQEVMLVVVPLAADLASAVRRQRQGDRASARRWLLDTLAMAAAACLAYLPQAAVSHVLFGGWWRAPQLYADMSGRLSPFAWSAPHLGDVLFSAWRGLFTWHPIYALAMLGVVPLWRKDKVLAAAVLVGVLGQAYVTGSWVYWWQGRAFGGRTFIGSLPLFAISLAALLDAVRQAFPGRRRVTGAVVAGMACLLVAANLLLAVEYRLVLSRSDRPATWRDLGPGRIEVLWQRAAGSRGAGR